MKIKLITQIDDSFEDKLSKFVREHPHGNFFQSIEYFNFYKSLSEYEPFILSCSDNDDNICGLLIAVIHKEAGYFKKKLTSRCIIYGGPIINNSSKLITDLILKELINTVNSKVIFIEFRNLFDVSSEEDIFKENGFNYKLHSNFILEITSLDENFKKLNKTKRWEINKGLKGGAKIHEAKDINEVEEFYWILKKLYLEKVKKPLPGFSFFENYFYNNLGKYFLVKYNDKVIGGTMCPIYKNKIYEWYEASLDKEYKQLYPGVLATWAPIEYAANNGLRLFDFLGAGSTDSEYGVREFKSKFGGELVNYGRYLRINKPLLYNLGKIGLKLLQKI